MVINAPKHYRVFLIGFRKNHFTRKIKVETKKCFRKSRTRDHKNFASSAKNFTPTFLALSQKLGMKGKSLFLLSAVQFVQPFDLNTHLVFTRGIDFYIVLYTLQKIWTKKTSTDTPLRL